MESIDFKLPLTKEDCMNLLNEAYHNETLLDKDSSKDILQTLEAWHGYVSKLSSLMRIFKNMEDEGNSLKDLIDKGYIS